MTSISLCPASNLGSPGSSSGFSVSLSRLCSTGPALTDHLLLRSLLILCLGDGHYQGAAPAIVPHPDVDLVESGAIVPVPLRVGRGASKTPIVLEAVLNHGLTVAADSTE